LAENEKLLSGNVYRHLFFGLCVVIVIPNFSFQGRFAFSAKNFLIMSFFH